MATALEGLRVLDLTSEIGHLAGRLLADLGAEVIKVEPPGGDAARKIGPFYQDLPDPNCSLLWWFLNLNKKGITLDVTREEGVNLLKRLAAQADVLLESYQPGFPASLGFDFTALRAVNRRIVVASITGFGQSGPYAYYRWEDIVGCALGGSANMNGDADRAPLRMPETQAYHHASLQGAMAVMMALYHRESSGEGQYIDVSMQEAVTQLLDGPGTFVNFWRLEGRNLTRMGKRRNMGSVTFQLTFRCQDGWIEGSGFTGTMGRARAGLLPLLREFGAEQDLGEEKWSKITLFAPGPGQVQGTPEEIDHICQVVEDWSRTRPKAEVAEALLKHGLNVFPVDDSRDSLANPQLNARGFFVDVEHPELGRSFKYPGAPFHLSETPLQFKRRAPLLGEHNAEVYGDLGLTAQEQATLQTVRVI